MAFPSSPQNGQIIINNNIAYTYDSTNNLWYRSGQSSANVITTDTANVTSNTASVSSTTGALTVAGGAGIAGNIYAGNFFFSNGTAILGSLPSPPTIANIQIIDSSYTVLDDTAVGLPGGNVLVNGAGFSSGATVLVGTIPAISTTFVNSTQVRALLPAMSAGTYAVFFVNGNGQISIKLPGITYSSFPSWVTGTTLPSQQSGSAISIQLSATGATRYYLATGSSLPSGLSLSTSGLLSGTVTVGTNTTYSFTINADDSNLQTSPQAFSLSVNTLILLQYTVTWSGDGVGQTAWDYGRSPNGLVFNTTDKNGRSMNSGHFPAAPGSVRITFIGTATNIDVTFSYTAVISPGASGGFETNSSVYQLIGPRDNVSSAYVNALNGETVIATVYLPA
jgi:hypothetical protein